MGQFGPQLTEEEFQAFSDLVHAKAGINLHTGKKELLRARLSARIRDGRFQSFGDYYNFVIQDQAGDELVQLLDSIATNLTSFFREPKHFAYMVDRFLPEIRAGRARSRERRLRIWSAGCSTGEEPYSIAMTLMSHMKDLSEWDVRILATDLSTKVLSVAVQGIYAADRIADLPAADVRRYFQPGQGARSGSYRIIEPVRRMVVFRRLNLMEKFPFKKPLNLIFCRNVMIYFDKPTQSELVGKFYEALAPGGYLFIGHSESLNTINHRFKYIQPTVYRK